MDVGRFSNYVPFLSTITNVKKLVDNARIKGVDETAALLRNQEPAEAGKGLEDIKARKLTKDEIVYSIIATFPFLGNLVVGIYDLGKHLSSRSNQPVPADTGVPAGIVNPKEKTLVEINGKLKELKKQFPETQKIIKGLVGEKLKDSDESAYTNILGNLQKCVPEKFLTPDRQVTIDALIRLGLTRDHLDKNDVIKTELAKKFFNIDTSKKSDYGYGFQQRSDVDEMKRELEPYFDSRVMFINKWG